MKKDIGRLLLNHWKKGFLIIIAVLIIWSYISDGEVEIREFPELAQPKTTTFEWEYKDSKYSITETFYKTVYDYYYLNPEKIFLEGNKEEDYYRNFLANIEAVEDNTISDIAYDIKMEARFKDLSDDELAELTVSFVQSIPYDDDKCLIIKSEPKDSYTTDEEGMADVRATWPRFPYEVLHDNKGVCSGKTFLAIALLKEMGYGTALFDYDELEHMAPAVKCPKEYSSYNSGYCYAETTEQGYMIGEIPPMDSGTGKPRARTTMELFGKDKKINLTSSLSDVEILKVADGNSYQGIIETSQAIQRINILEERTNLLERTINSMENEIAQLENNITSCEQRADEAYRIHEISGTQYSYNKYLQIHNQCESIYVGYENKYNIYNGKINEYNKLIYEYNNLIEGF